MATDLTDKHLSEKMLEFCPTELMINEKMTKYTVSYTRKDREFESS